MDSGLYAAATALMARTDALDTIANNLANSSTGGFRARHTSFSSVLAGYGHPLETQLNEATNNYGLLGSSHLDMQTGSLERTGGDLDVGIDGPGFLSVQTASGTAYTRSGGLKVSPQGQLTTAAGDPILGTSGPITIPKGSTPMISGDGTISVDGAVAGKLKLVEFAPTADPQSMGNTYYTVPAKDVVDATKSQVRQGMLEGSNVNPVQSVIELINAQRAAEGMRHAMTMIDTEIDKTAATDLPRVGN
jgi:flagellar basal-body rod protein FlgF